MLKMNFSLLLTALPVTGKGLGWQRYLDFEGQGEGQKVLDMETPQMNRFAILLHQQICLKYVPFLLQHQYQGHFRLCYQDWRPKNCIFCVGNLRPFSLCCSCVGESVKLGLSKIKPYFKGREWQKLEHL